MLWAIIWQLCMTKPQSFSRPCRSTCAATSEMYYSTISECEQRGEEKHSLKEWKCPWPHLQCVRVCVGVSMPPHPALHTPLPAIGRSGGLTGRKIISCFHQRINRAWHYKYDSYTQNVKWFSWMSIVSVNHPIWEYYYLFCWSNNAYSWSCAACCHQTQNIRSFV